MPRTIRRISTLVYGLGIVGALAFGANEALGRAVNAGPGRHRDSRRHALAFNIYSTELLPTPEESRD